MNARTILVRDGGETRLAGGCYLALKLAGWIAITACCVASVWVGVFVFLGEFDFAQTMLHIDNLAARYLAADPGRREGFERLFWVLSAVMFALFALFRRHGLPAFRFNSKENDDG